MTDFIPDLEVLFAHYGLPAKVFQLVAGLEEGEDTGGPTMAAPQPKLDEALQQLVKEYPNLPGAFYSFLSMHFLGGKFDAYLRDKEGDMIQLVHERRRQLMQFAILLLRVERFLCDRAGVGRESVTQCPLPLINFVYLVQHYAIDNFAANQARLEAQLKRVQLPAIGDVLQAQYMTPVVLLEVVEDERQQNPVEAAYMEAAAMSQV